MDSVQPKLTANIAQLPKKVLFAEAYSDLSRLSEDVPSWVKDLREESMAGFRVQGLPTTRQEEWKYTSLRPLQDLEFGLLYQARDDKNEAINPIAKNEVSLVFVDGVLAGLPVHLPQGLTVKNLAKAFFENETLVRQALLRTDLRSGNAFFNLNQAFLSQGSFIEVAADAKIENILHLVFLSSGRETQQKQTNAIFSRNIIVVHSGASLELVENYLGQGEERYLNNVVTNLLIAENAKVNHIKIQTEAANAFHVSSVNAAVSAHSRLNTFVLNFGAALSRTDTNIVINGQESEVNVDGLYLGQSGQHMDHQVTVQHKAPLSQSSQTYKGILRDRSRAVFNGKIIVQREAQQTKAMQVNKTLLLSDLAEVDTKPELQIDADDVKCNHGAAVGQLDPEEIFYLQSRGIRAKDAAVMLSRAFAADVVLKIENEAIKSKILEMFANYFVESTPTDATV